MIYYGKGSSHYEFTLAELEEGLCEALDLLGQREKVLAVPPDYTRLHSFAGDLTRFSFGYFGKALTDILPASGTHTAMTAGQLEAMFGKLPRRIFRAHDWRKDLVTLGEIPGEFIRDISEGKLDYSIKVQVNELLAGGGHDLILSIGQVVPHEVIGMANYNKNILVGTGGAEMINKSHFLGAVYGMERLMGRANNPVRQVMNYACDQFASHLPIVYVLTVVGKNGSGDSVVRGLFIGDDMACFEKAAELSLKVNFEMLDEPLDKVVVYLNSSEYKSTWLGNKSIYRTRMAIADGGELMILAPGLREFGEDKEIDSLIRKYGYLTTPEILAVCQDDQKLQENLSAAAHLIHGSAENRFKITYCPGNLSKEEMESVNYQYADLAAAIRKYDPGKLRDGFNLMPDGEKIFYVSNPAMGLWACRDRFIK